MRIARCPAHAAALVSVARSVVLPLCPHNKTASHRQNAGANMVKHGCLASQSSNIML